MLPERILKQRKIVRTGQLRFYDGSGSRDGTSNLITVDHKIRELLV